ncbi:restriction endonuclease subunit S, partial [Vibrio anguillarum]|nr:restriction endonuclease subunit S [Vibrio anguillarum]
AEQHRIVDKVDELMALCDQLEQQTETSIEAHQVLVTTLLDTLTNSADADELMQNWARISEHFDTLFTTEESIDQLKQTILQLAVMGKLVPQDPSDEPVSKLLERIKNHQLDRVQRKEIQKPKKASVSTILKMD